MALVASSSETLESLAAVRVAVAKAGVPDAFFSCASSVRMMSSFSPRSPLGSDAAEVVAFVIRSGCRRD